MRGLDGVGGSVWHQRMHGGMARLAAEGARHFLAPPGQFGGGDAGVVNLIDDVVDFAAEGVEGRDRRALRRRQKAKRVVERRAALGGFVLHVLLGCHEACTAAAKVARFMRSAHQARQAKSPLPI
jgi:hypothetical protein